MDHWLTNPVSSKFFFWYIQSAAVAPGHPVVHVRHYYDTVAYVLLCAGFLLACAMRFLLGWRVVGIITFLIAVFLLAFLLLPYA
jgi:hypothetical protein